jgi:imidazolonepropionase-like amidohydrolase
MGNRCLLACVHVTVLGTIGCGARTLPEQDHAALALTHATVIDVASGTPRHNMTVLISGNRIRAVGPTGDVAVPLGARQLDLSGRVLIPGLWDMHVHALFDSMALSTMLPAFLANGVTGIRDMGGSVAVMRRARTAQQAGQLTAPRMVASGAVLDGPQPVDPDISFAIHDSAGAAAIVDSLARAGADFIKVYTLLPPEAFYAAAAAARRRGLPLAGHIPHGVSDVAAAPLMRSVEHMRVETGGFCTPTTRAVCDSAFAAFRAHHTWQTPTLSVRKKRSQAADSALFADPRLAYTPATLRQVWEASRLGSVRRGPEYLAHLALRYRDERWIAVEMIRAGLPILAGSDAGSSFSMAGFTLHEELRELAAAGLGAAGALRAATLGAAEYLGATDSLGTLEPGKVADIVVLSADPLAAVGNTESIVMLIYDGRVFDRAALDALLRGAAAAAH